MRAVYFDTNYLIKLQFDETGSAAVRAQAAKVDLIYCSLHGKAEFFSACHRKVREGSATLAQSNWLYDQLQVDTVAGALQWLPVDDRVVARVERVYREAPSDTFLRGADAIHLASASEAGFRQIFSNDRHLLAAAPLFNLSGINVI